VVALDLTEQMLEQTLELAGERSVDNLTTRLGDVEALPFEAARFDIVTCRLCAHHVERPARALAEIARVLVPHGQLVLVDIVSPETPMEATFLNAIEILRDPSHVRDHAISEWLAMLGAAGFAPEVLNTWPLRQRFGDWVARIGASEAAIRALETLFDAASEALRDSFRIDAERGFDLRNALLYARLG
jgi:SAM-dependent methyltransferase